MVFIKGLFSTLSIIAGINALSSIFWYLPQKINDPVETNENDEVWTWKRTLSLVLTLCSMAITIAVTLYLSKQYGYTVQWILFVLSYYLNKGTSIFPSARIIGDIVKGTKTGELNLNESTAILTLALIMSYCNIFKLPDRLQTYTNSLSNTILSDWILIVFYIISIFICVFFCCSLSLTPLKLLIKYARKLYMYIPRQKINSCFVRIEPFAYGALIIKTHTAALLEYSVQKILIFKLLLWILVIPTILFDIFVIIVVFVFKLLASIILDSYLIIKQFLSVIIKAAVWLTKLKSRNVVAISFRIAIILAFGLSVIINKYEPFLRNYEESSFVLEFVSSSIIIPIIFEWIFSYKKSKNNNSKQEGQ